MQPNTPIPVLPNPPKISMDISLLDGLPSGQDPSSTSAHISPNPAPSLTPIQPDHKNMSQQNHTNQEVPNIPKPKFVPYPNPNNPVITEVKAHSNLTPTMPAPPKPLPSTYQQPNLKGVYKAKRVFKVIIIGDAGVGKTCLSFRFCNGRFPGQTEATIGVDFRERALVLDNELIRVQLWDTAGQERYRQSIVAHYYRNVNAVVYVYDVTNPESFRSLPSWINECKKHAVHCSDDTPHILIGNKCDLMAESRVKTDEAQVFADQNDMAHFETSALADSESDHVESIFMTLVHKLRHSKPMHVQTDQERVEKEQKLLLKADEAAKLEDQEGFCC